MNNNEKLVLGVVAIVLIAGATNARAYSMSSRFPELATTPPPTVWWNLWRLNRALGLFNDELPVVVFDDAGNEARAFVVTSAYRSPELSAALYAALGRPNNTRSKHLDGKAADLVPLRASELSMAALTAAARDSGLFSYVLNEGDHVHVEIS